MHRPAWNILYHERPEVTIDYNPSSTCFTTRQKAKCWMNKGKPLPLEINGHQWRIPCWIWAVCKKSITKSLFCYCWLLPRLLRDLTEEKQSGQRGGKTAMELRWVLKGHAKKLSPFSWKENSVHLARETQKQVKSSRYPSYSWACLDDFSISRPYLHEVTYGTVSLFETLLTEGNNSVPVNSGMTLLH